MYLGEQYSMKSLQNRRDFIRNTGAIFSFAPLIYSGTGCAVQHKGPNSLKKKLQLSLAQWSLHRSFNAGELSPDDFVQISREKYGINAVEYVNQFYVEQANNERFWQSMKRRADDVGVKSLLIMIDDEGELGDADDQARTRAVENHYKWVHAAKILGCHSIRVNAFGPADIDSFRKSTVDGMGRLCEYAQEEGISVIIENHGLHSSNAQLITGIIEEVNMPNFGTFPDFGNWCLSAKWGSIQRECEVVYDPYKGVNEMLPFAKAVSAKSYDFTEDGDHPRIDYWKMVRIVKHSGYDGHIGIEYEGQNLTEHEGILATKALIERVWEEV